MNEQISASTRTSAWPDEASLTLTIRIEWPVTGAKPTFECPTDTAVDRLLVAEPGPTTDSSRPEAGDGRTR